MTAVTGGEAGAAPVCATCGTRAEVPFPPTWSVSVEDGRRVWTCGPCAREHLRSIEAKLGREWW